MSDIILLKSLLHSDCSIELLISVVSNLKTKINVQPSFMWCKVWFVGCLGWTDQCPRIKLFIYLPHFSQNMLI